MAEFREILAPDGRQWRVWAVRPKVVAGERRAPADRRASLVDFVVRPASAERRGGADRRDARPGPADLLPEQWRDGWLVFDEEVPETAAAGGEVRRLAPIPPGWEAASDEELVSAMERAVVSRKWAE